MRIWRSLDLVVTLAASVTVGVLSMLDLGGTSLLAGTTLATLGILVTGTFAARVQLRGLAETSAELADLTRRHLVDPPSADRVLSASASGADVDLAGAGDIGIVGVTLNRTLRNHLVALQQCVRRGGTVRIAVIDPRGEVVGEAARRSTVPDSASIFTHRLQPTLDLLHGLAAVPGPGRVEVRLLDFVPAFGLLAVDAGEPNGRVHVDIYSHTFGGREPALALRASHDPGWYQHFVAEFEQIWQSGIVCVRKTV